ncbi:MAG: hypothetical protein WB562_14820 [Candidatus Sulfotelmatobacter sp.]
MNTISSAKHKTLDILLLWLLTAGALLVHGYHPYAEDAEIYLPGVERILHPGLFPVGQEFFASHASLTLFPNLIALSVHTTHLPLEWGLLLWHVVSIFLLLLACWQLSGFLFQRARARWGAVCLIAALLTIPVAGTALYIMDQFLNPRNLAAFAGIFAVTRTLEKKYVRALLWLGFAGSMHPLMWVFPFSFCVLLLVMERLAMDRLESRPRSAATTGLAGLSLWLPLAPAASPAYHEAAKLHGYLFIQNWEWYEWLGILAPVVLLWWFARVARARQWREVDRLCRLLILYDLIYFAAALVVDLPARFESLARLQPLRNLYLLYLLMFVVMGGFLGEYVLKNRVWRWLALFLPLAGGMFLAQRALFPASAHLELPGEAWPWKAIQNDWAKAFLWIRGNTPVDAVFALDPEYMHIAGEDEVGFRCLAERSRLADAVKDSGAVSMFPALAEEWRTQVQAQTPWKNFQAEDFARLKNQYGVSWVVVQQPGIAGMDCAYQNAAVRVCQVR